MVAVTCKKKLDGIICTAPIIITPILTIAIFATALSAIVTADFAAILAAAMAVVMVMFRMHFIA